MRSILTDIKGMFGLSEGDQSFDKELIININSVFTILKQLGVGPVNGFRINDSNAEWSDFIDDEYQLDLVKTYIYLKVKLMFDISTMTSPLIDVVKNQISECEWRLNAAADPGWNTNSSE